jgi:hypothetical protein
LSFAALLPPTAAAQSASCTFQNGFAVIRETVGDEIVGNCRENEHVNFYTGRVEQLTSTGVLYWRPCDNITLFTDSNVVWVNGPFGIQNRLAFEAPFQWEPAVECVTGPVVIDNLTPPSGPAPVAVPTAPPAAPTPAPAVSQLPERPTAESCPDKVVIARNVDFSYRNHPQGMNWRCADAYHVKLLGADLSGSDLSQANLSTADVSRATFANARMALAHLVALSANGSRTVPGPIFTSADMRGVKMSSSALTQADFRYADLSNADVSRSNFTLADLRGADLRGADLSQANFTSANLTGAYLCGANTTGTTFKDAVGVSTSCG